jgi:ribosome-associated translation inhibitor RaiA
MQVLFESRDAQGSKMRELAVRRVRFVMRRLAWLVPRAKVQMEDVNGPRGGVDKRCQIELKTDSAGTVVITSMARDWRTALETALSRAARSLVRIWRRGRKAARQPALGYEAGGG